MRTKGAAKRLAVTLTTVCPWRKVFVQQMHPLPLLSELRKWHPKGLIWNQRRVKTHAIFLVQCTCRLPNFIALDGAVLLLEIICTYTHGSIHPQYIKCSHQLCMHNKSAWNLLVLPFFRMYQLGLSRYNWTELKKIADLNYIIPGSSVIIKGKKTRRRMH